MNTKQIRYQIIELKANRWQLIFLLALILLSTHALAHDALAPLPDTIEKIKPSIVGVGTMQKTRRPPAQLRGTGFVVADGRHVITTAHNLPEKLDRKKKEFLAVFAGQGANLEIREVTVASVDEHHDLMSRLADVFKQYPELLAILDGLRPASLAPDLVSQCSKKLGLVQWRVQCHQVQVGKNVCLRLVQRGLAHLRIEQIV